MKKQVVVVCYDRIEKWHDRRNAITFYLRGAEECDGLEALRYSRIAADLMDGADIATDGESMSIRECAARGLFRITPAPDGSRDFGGKTWFPKNKTN